MSTKRPNELLWKTVLWGCLFLTIGLGSVIWNAHRSKDMRAYLNATEDLVRAGRYPEALERHLWFHKHALEFEPAMRGVRLSFALSDWEKMAESYPPARAAMVKVRDDDAEALKNGQDSIDLFCDVAALNRTLLQDGKTIELFQLLAARNEAYAQHYWIYAEDPVFDAQPTLFMGVELRKENWG